MSRWQFCAGLVLIDIAIGALAHDFTLLGRLLIVMFVNIGLALLTPPFDRL